MSRGWNIFTNILQVGARIVGSFVSLAGAIATGGATAPFAALSLISTTSAIRDFINDPSGDVNRTLESALSAGWIEDTIKIPNARQHIIRLTNSSTDPVQGMISPLGIREARTQLTHDERQRGVRGVRESSLAAMSDPAIRLMRTQRGNVHSRMRNNLVNLSIDMSGYSHIVNEIQPSSSIIQEA